MLIFEAIFNLLSIIRETNGNENEINSWTMFLVLNLIENISPPPKMFQHKHSN